MKESNKKFDVEIKGPKQKSIRDDKNYIKEKISKRAEDLKIKNSTLIDNTVKDISHAQTAEGMVLLSEIKIEMPKHSTNAKARITLKMCFDENLAQPIQELLDYYVLIRISNIAQAMHMEMESPLSKS